MIAFRSIRSNLKAFTIKHNFVILIVILLNVTKFVSGTEKTNNVPGPYSYRDVQISPKYEEYYIEHNVTLTDAKKSFKEHGIHIIGENQF